MASILHIDSSPRGERSKSRKLAKKFIDAWQDLHPDDLIIYRDLRQTPVPHVTEDWIAASFTAPEALTSEMAELLKFSNELVDEFLAADRCVFSVPMYNFSIPSNFKAYIDQVFRVGVAHSWRRMVKSKDLRTVKKFCSSHREALSLKQGLLTKDGIVRNLRSGMLFNTWV